MISDLDQEYTLNIFNNTDYPIQHPLSTEKKISYVAEKQIALIQIQKPETIYIYNKNEIITTICSKW